MNGDIIKYWRKEKRMTQKELADKLQITQNAISLYESNKRKIDMELYDKLAQALNVTKETLLFGKTQEITANDLELLESINSLSSHEREAIKQIIKSLAQGKSLQETG